VYITFEKLRSADDVDAGIVSSDLYAAYQLGNAVIKSWFDNI
jgi:hypothetical protein